jgi:hypothetical protein
MSLINYRCIDGANICIIAKNYFMSDEDASHAVRSENNSKRLAICHKTSCENQKQIIGMSYR